MIRETVEIYGEAKGTRFMLPLAVQYNPSEVDIEHAIILTLKGHGYTFEDLAASFGWRDAYWTYPSGAVKTTKVS